MRSGHGPFNTPERFRGKSTVGILGDMTLETDEIIGKIWDSLEKSNKMNNTVILFMSDNGSAYRHRVRELFEHDQNSISFKEKWFSLKGGKNDIYEGGHRVPFMVWYPKLFPPQQNFDSLVSQMDIYKTLADLIGAKLKCNEAPDSRTLMPILTGENIEEPFEKGQRHLIHHGMKKNYLSLRRGDFKWIPVTNELYNLRKDLGETKNLFETTVEYRNLAISMNITLFTRITKIEDREKRNQIGTNDLC